MALISFVERVFFCRILRRQTRRQKASEKPPFILFLCDDERRETFDDDDAKSFSRSKGTRAETHPRGNDDDREE
jgi:hypothetical protein